MNDIHDILTALDESASLRKTENLIFDLKELTRKINSGNMDREGFLRELTALGEKHGLTDGSTRQ